MRKIKDVLRLHAAGLSQRHIATSLKLSNGVVCKYLRLAQAAGVSWPLPPQWNDQDLAQRLSPPVAPTDVAVTQGAEPDFVTIHQELKRKGVTRQLLWEEYQHAHSDAAYSYPQFCLLYRTWAGRLQRSLRQTHIAGEKLFVDYAGPTAAVVDASTGEIKPAQIFVAVWGASNFTYAEATTRRKASADANNDVDASTARLDRLTRARLWFFRRRACADCSGQSESGGEPRLPLRTGIESHLCRLGGALRHGGVAGTAV